MQNSRLFVVFALLASITGCRCGPTRTGELAPDFDPTPKALAFMACPTLDETGKPVQDVFPDEQKVSLINLGKAAGPVEISFAGTDKAAFSVPAADVPESLGSSSTVEIPVHFSPTKKSDSVAEMIIDDGNDETPTVSVSLTGSTPQLAAQPKLIVDLQNKDDKKFESCFTADGTYKGTCSPLFADTFFKTSSSLELKVRNAGCPALKITGVELAPLGSASADLAFSLESPSVSPTPGAPIVLTTAGGSAETTLKVKFAPENDGSGNTQRYSTLTLVTNDPERPRFDILLVGNAAVPSVYTQPTYCDFSLGTDLCGNVTKVADKARFEVRNGGNTAITIDSVAFSKPGQTRFTISQNVQGQSVLPGELKILEVSHSDKPLYVTELLTVTASSTNGPAGNAILTLSGGKKPCLTTEPGDQLDFKNPTAKVSTATVAIKNGAGCGDLVVDSVTLDPSTRFKLVDPLLPAGTTIPAGGSQNVTVEFTKSATGGQDTGVLHFTTNDPDYAPSKIVLLYGETPLNQLPVADAKGCLPTDPTCAAAQSPSMTVQLSKLTPKEITITAKDSTDPGNTSANPISEYRFQLLPPSNATGASLENNGQKTANDKAKLTLDPTAVGLYRVIVTVWDDTGLQSSSSAELKIFVNQ